MIDTLVLSSGGTKGISFVGALEYLDKFYSIFDEKLLSVYIGTSIGALICGLLSLGIQIADLKTIILNTEFISLFCDIKILNFINNMGIINPDNIKQKIRHILTTSGFDSAITLEKLHELTKKDLYLVTVDLVTEKVVYLSHKTFPKMTFIDAVLSSMSIPFVFPPVKYDGYCFVDGALLEPVCFNTEIYGKTPLVLDIVREKSIDVSGVGNYILKIVHTVINNRRDETISNLPEYYVIKTNEKNILDTTLDSKKIECLLLEGFESIKSCIKVKHD